MENSGVQTSKIGTLNEKHLHEALKQWYTQPGDRLEENVDGSIVDIVRGDCLIEIQTANFSAIRQKIRKLLANHPVRLVYPVAGLKWIIKLPEKPEGTATRRRSPRKGSFGDVFKELIRCPDLILIPGFSLEILLIESEEVRRYDGVRGWRRHGWVIEEHRLVAAREKMVIAGPHDLAVFIPPGLQEPFTTADLAAAAGQTRSLAQKMVYCLSRTGCLFLTGKKGNALLYSRHKP